MIIADVPDFVSSSSIAGISLGSSRLEIASNLGPSDLCEYPNTLVYGNLIFETGKNDLVTRIQVIYTNKIERSDIELEKNREFRIKWKFGIFTSYATVESILEHDLGFERTELVSGEQHLTILSNRAKHIDLIFELDDESDTSRIIEIVSHSLVS